MANYAMGFYDLQSYADMRVTEVGESVVWDAVTQSVAEHNRQVNALIPLFCRMTTDFKAKFQTPAAARLQAVTEAGRARPVKLNAKYDLAWPLQMGATAWGTNFVTLNKLSVADANRLTSAMLSADRRWVRDHILAALFANSSWTFGDDEKGDLVIKGLANGDTDEYGLISGDSTTTDTHYLAQAGAIADDANPFPTIFDELSEHPENSGDVIVLIPSNLKSAIEGLADYTAVQDPNIAMGLASDTLVGVLPVETPGTVIGYVDRCWIVEWRSLPNSYMIGLTTDGERALSMRQDPEPELNGFRPVASRDNFPFTESQWIRRAGFGAWNRVGAVVYRVGNASYAIPTGYSSPMA